MRIKRSLIAMLLVVFLSATYCITAQAATSFSQTQYFQKLTPEANSITVTQGEDVVLTVKFLGPGGMDSGASVGCGLIPYGDGEPGWPSYTQFTSGSDYTVKGSYSYADKVLTCKVSTADLAAGTYYFSLTYYEKSRNQYASATQHWLYQEVKITGNTTAPVNPPKLMAKPTSSKVYINGKLTSFDAYNIDGSNYFKLRDLAYALSKSEKQFEVQWDGANNAILLTSGKPYTVAGGEMQEKGSGDKTPTLTASKILLDGKEVSFTAYNIDGANYFKLRDIGKAFDFGVSWDGKNNAIIIATAESYSDD